MSGPLALEAMCLARLFASSFSSLDCSGHSGGSCCTEAPRAQAVSCVCVWIYRLCARTRVSKKSCEDCHKKNHSLLTFAVFLRDNKAFAPPFLVFFHPIIRFLRRVSLPSSLD